MVTGGEITLKENVALSLAPLLTETRKSDVGGGEGGQIAHTIS